MESRKPIEFRTSVRELVEFVHRTGNLGGDGHFNASNRAVEGTRGHRRLQQARGDGYRAEVSVQRDYEREGVKLKLTGRVDGIMEGATPVVVEEIKTVDKRWSGRQDAVHFAQLRVYAALLAEANQWSAVEMRLTYLDLETDLETTFRETETLEVLSAFLERTLGEWFEWLSLQAAWVVQRNASLENLAFPFDTFRLGQRELARSVFKAARDGGNLFLEAPTGLGKTLATLFPAVRALPRMGEGQVFYITAKTPGRFAAEHALEKLRKGGALIRSVMLTAKKKICFTENAAGCDLRTCPFAQGYFDRIKPAVKELLAREHLDRTTIEELARTHQVCPFELSLDASLWTDVVIGDFNYVFDPSARLQRHFGEGESAKHVVLVDEAHNLVDRSREMYSASLTADELEVGRGAPKGRGASGAKRAIAEARKELQSFLEDPDLKKSNIPEKGYHHGALAFDEVPKELLAALKQASRSVEKFLADQEPGRDLSGWLEPWFAIGSFLKAAEGFDATCRTIAVPSESRVTLFCADPSKRLQETLKGLRATIFFTATLSPLEYFRDLLGGSEKDVAASFDSPFLAEQMALSVLGVDVSFKGRADSLSAVAQAVAAHVGRMPGNHLVFCPSLDYLASLEGALGSLLPDAELFTQSASMDETQREAFLGRFSVGGKSVGLAVLGGIFAEGVDLPGDRLVGVSVIGVGLPRLSLERDILQAHFQASRGEGFDYAYRFPGMQRVLQAVGRLIRTEEDRGAALLVDKRFNEGRYRVLFPAWWNATNQR